MVKTGQERRELNMKTSLRRTVAGDKKKKSLTLQQYVAQQCKMNALLRCHGNNVYKNDTQYYVIRTLSVLFVNFFNQFTVTMDDPKQCVKDQQNESADSSAVCLDGSVLRGRNVFCDLEEVYLS